MNSLLLLLVTFFSWWRHEAPAPPPPPTPPRWEPQRELCPHVLRALRERASRTHGAPRRRFERLQEMRPFLPRETATVLDECERWCEDVTATDESIKH